MKQSKSSKLIFFIFSSLVIVVLGLGGTYYTVRYFLQAQSACFTVQEIQNDSRCLYILNGKVYEKGTRDAPHKGNPCGTDVSSIILPFHTDNPVLYLDPNLKGTVCDGNQVTQPTATPEPTATPQPPTSTPQPTATPQQPTATPTPSTVQSQATATPTTNQQQSSSVTATSTPTPSLSPTSSYIGGTGITPTRTPTPSGTSYTVDFDITLSPTEAESTEGTITPSQLPVTSTLPSWTGIVAGGIALMITAALIF